MARFSYVHADTPKQVPVRLIVACYLWLTCPTGEELCTNYVVGQCGFPGMPWAVRPARQQKLLDGYVQAHLLLPPLHRHHDRHGVGACRICPMR